MADVDENGVVSRTRKRNGCEKSNVREAERLIYVVRSEALEFKARGMIGGNSLPSGIVAMSGSAMVDSCRAAAFRDHPSGLVTPALTLVSGSGVGWG